MFMITVYGTKKRRKSEKNGGLGRNVSVIFHVFFYEVELELFLHTMGKF